MSEPTEYLLLEAARAKLEAATGAGYNYSAGAAYLVSKPQIKHLAEGFTETTLYLVSPGDNSPQDYSQCATLFPGDFLVTACIRIGSPELPWLTGYVSPVLPQLRMVADIYKALHLQEIAGATIKMANRNLDIEADGWATAQVQMSFEYSEVDP